MVPSPLLPTDRYGAPGTSTSAPQAASQRKILNPITQIIGIVHLRDQCQVADRLADRQVELMTVNQPGKRVPRALMTVCDRQQVVVLTEEHPAQCGCPLQEMLIIPGLGSVLPTREDVDSPLAQPFGDRGIHVMIQVEPDTHGSSPRSRSLRRPGDSS